MSGPSIADVVNRYDVPFETRTQMILALTEREAAMADFLRQAGMQFGLFPQIVAEVLAECELGGRVEAEQRALIRQQFAALMEQIAAAQQGGGDFPSPPPPTSI